MCRFVCKFERLLRSYSSSDEYCFIVYSCIFRLSHMLWIQCSRFDDSFGQGQANKYVDYPLEFNMFIDKQVLFKVEVSERNVKKKFLGIMQSRRGLLMMYQY